MNGNRTEVLRGKRMCPFKVAAAPRNRAGELALDLYACVLDEVRADRLVRRAVRLEGNILRVGGTTIPLAEVRRLLVVGAGKASAGMAAGLEDVLGSRIAEGIVVTKYGHGADTRVIRVREAAHPIPDEASVAAGAAIMDLVQRAEAQDLVICLISGGASALMELPVEGVDIEDLRLVTELLLRCGAEIRHINRVRASLSRIKAGGLARAASPARVLCLAISDVLGNPPGAIGSGPCVASPAFGGDARAVLEQYGLVERVPPNVLRALELPPAPQGPENGGSLHFEVIGDVGVALDVAWRRAQQLGLNPLILTQGMRGEAREIGGLMGAVARDFPQASARSGVRCVLMGGEPTVTVRGKGSGGRAQELALAAALAMADGSDTTALLAAGTDGTDGPTDAAGGLVDASTARRAAEAGVNPALALADNDSYHALQAAGALVTTGPTQSNVNDLVIVVEAGGT
ncbi:MAG: glycerate kinase type-2 family protein [Chthonomonadales bacterium]